VVISLGLAGAMILVALVWFPRRWDPSEALHRAVLDCDAVRVETMIDEGADLNAVQDGRTPLINAIRRGNLRVAELLVRRGADVDKADLRWDYTPLHWAVDSSRPRDFAELLIASGADIRATEPHGWTPLHVAAVEDEPDLVEVFADAGADVNAKTLDGNTPLHFATMWRARGAAAAPLIESSADVNAKNSFGLTPIHYAAMRDQYEVVKLLIQHGADLSTRDIRGRTVLAWALLGCRSSSEVLKLLRSHGAEE
jgi:ankyrin repeat protein